MLGTVTTLWEFKKGLIDSAQPVAAKRAMLAKIEPLPKMNVRLLQESLTPLHFILYWPIKQEFLLILLLL